MQERAGNVLAQFTGEGGPPRRRPARAPRALRDPHPVATAASTRGCCRATACQLALPRPASRTPPRSRESGMPVARDRHRATPDPAGRPRSTQQGDSTGHARRGPGPQRSPHGPAHQQCRWRLGAIRSRARNLTTVMPRTGSGLELEFRGREGISGTPRPSLGSCRAPRCGWPSPGTRRTSWGRPTDSAIDRPAYIAPSTGFGCDRAALIRGRCRSVHGRRAAAGVPGAVRIDRLRIGLGPQNCLAAQGRVGVAGPFGVGDHRQDAPAVEEVLPGGSRTLEVPVGAV